MQNIMKSRTLLLIMILAMIGCSNTFAQGKKEKKDNKKETVLFDVSMTCENCKKRIEKNIAYEKGVSDMQVNLTRKTVSVTYRKDKTSVDNLLKAFEKLGYTAAVHSDVTAKAPPTQDN